LPAEADGIVTVAGDELETDATASVDHRELGITWSPLASCAPRAS
jgi:hypothetical protein